MSRIASLHPNIQLSTSRLTLQAAACGASRRSEKPASKIENIFSPACPAAVGYCPSGERRQSRTGFRKESSRWTKTKSHRGRTLAFSPPPTDNFLGLVFSSWRCSWPSALRACNRGPLHKLLTRHCEVIRPASRATNRGLLVPPVPNANKLWLRV